MATEIVIKDAMSAIWFMAELEKHLLDLADMEYDPEFVRYIYAGGSVSMVRHELLHSVQDIDLAFGNPTMARKLVEKYGKEYFKNYVFKGVPIDFGPNEVSLDVTPETVGHADHGYFYSLEQLRTQYAQLLAGVDPDNKILVQKYSGRLYQVEAAMGLR